MGIAALTAAASVAALALAPAASQAYTPHNYCNTAPLKGGEWCPGPEERYLTGNVALYQGAGVVSVCQSVFVEGYFVVTNTCGNNSTGAANNVESYAGQGLSEFPFVKYEGFGTKTILGTWYSR